MIFQIKTLSAQAKLQNILVRVKTGVRGLEDNINSTFDNFPFFNTPGFLYFCLANIGVLFSGMSIRRSPRMFYYSDQATYRPIILNNFPVSV